MITGLILGFLAVSFVTRPAWTIVKLMFDWNPLFPC